jgi:valyl-tRNA synthetase
MIDKHYSPKDLEARCYEKWIQADLFKKSYELDSKKTFSMMLPPPNVTGTLHMGHAFQDTLMDALVRRHRQEGYATLWQVGLDHAGIATQMVVERQLEAQGVKRTDIGREEFVQKIWDWKENSGGKILEQLKRLGLFMPWERERFTMDKDFTYSVTHAFVSLYKEGLISRREKLVNWDCHLQSAVSDLEVEYEEEMGVLYHLKYQIEGTTQFLQVATTRPETIFGDVAIAVHPDDERYVDLIGQSVLVPLIARSIPIIQDQRVIKDFGSGCVKITPAHDFLDFEIGQDHQLESITILTEEGKLNSLCPSNLQGIDRLEARPMIAKMLCEYDALVLEQDYEHQVPRCSRTGQVIEPRLTTQWFLEMEQMAKEGLEALEKNHIEFIPTNWSKHYCHWLENIQPWCLSRQLWWGHRIPAWYDKQGHIYVGYSEKDVRESHQLCDEIELTQDSDVLDTWFSSALWPMATLGWPTVNTIDWEKFFPTGVLVTGFDIIFFWVARMIMFSMHFTKKVPFKDIYIHGILQDSHGQKMSKSKGNVIDPCDLIDGISLDALVEKRTNALMQPQMAHKIAKQTRKEFPEGFPALGADALRFTFCSQASPGRFIKFDLQKLQSSSNFCNKIWNMARFAMMHFDQKITIADLKPLYPLDFWIIGKLEKAKKDLERHYQVYRFDLVATTLYELSWNCVCDWYIELLKIDLVTHKEHSVKMLYYVLVETLSMLHPVMPFITEEIYCQLKEFSLSQLPSFIIESNLDRLEEDQKSYEQMSFLILCMEQIRALRTRIGIAKKARLELIVDPSQVEMELLKDKKFSNYLSHIAGIEKISTEDLKTYRGEKALKLHLSHSPCFLTLPAEYDVSTHLDRFEKDLSKVRKETSSLAGRLSNENFLKKAPANVVEKEKDELAKLRYTEEDLSVLISQLKEYS